MGWRRISENWPLVRNEESDLIIDGEKVPLKVDWQFQPPDKRAFQTKIKIPRGLSLHVRIGDRGRQRLDEIRARSGSGSIA